MARHLDLRSDDASELAGLSIGLTGLQQLHSIVYPVDAGILGRSGIKRSDCSCDQSTAPVEGRR